MMAVFMSHSLVEVFALQFHVDIDFYPVLSNFVVVFYVIVPALVAIFAASTARDEVRAPISHFTGYTTGNRKLIARSRKNSKPHS